MAETVHFPARPATVVRPWHRGSELFRNRLARILEVISTGSKVFRMNPILFFLWILFPLFLVLTSDWIGLLVVFQAITAAVRLRHAPVARKLSYCSSSSAPASRIKGEIRVLR